MRLFLASLFAFIAVSVATGETQPKPASPSPVAAVEMKGHHIGENVLELPCCRESRRKPDALSRSIGRLRADGKGG